MARGHGRILTSIWEDQDFLALDPHEQRLYMFLISQPNLNHAGLLPLTLRRWARKARGLTIADVEKTLADLEQRRFVVVDDDAEELLIRTFVRNDGVWRMPKVMAAMVSGAGEITSPKLRRALLSEMSRLPLDELSDAPGARGPSVRQQIVEHLTQLRQLLQTPDPEPPNPGQSTLDEGFGKGIGNPSGIPSNPAESTLREGFGKGIENPSGTLSEPFADPSDTGREPTTRGRAATRDARSPAPAPAPTPKEEPTGAVADEDHAELVVVEDSDFVGADESARADPEPVTAQTIVAEWIERCAKRPPSNVIGQTSKQIKKLLDEGIDPDDIRAGLARWMRRGSAPSAIPNFVNEAMNAAPTNQPASNVFPLPGQSLTGTDARVAGWMALADQLTPKGDSA